MLNNMRGNIQSKVLQTTSGVIKQNLENWQQVFCLLLPVELPAKLRREVTPAKESTPIRYIFDMKYIICLCLILCMCISGRCKTNQDTIDTSIVVSKVERKIDIASHLVKVSSSLTVENTGRSSVKSFLFAVEPALQDKLSYLGASVRILNEKTLRSYKIRLQHFDQSSLDTYFRFSCHL